MIGGYPCNYNQVGLTANEKGTIHLTTCEAQNYFAGGCQEKPYNYAQLLQHFTNLEYSQHTVNKESENESGTIPTKFQANLIARKLREKHRKKGW